MKNNAEQSLYNLLITQNLEPEILDSTGRPVTDPSKAELFSFDYVTDNQDYGTVVILISEDNQLEVYFGDNLGRGMEADDKSTWYEFLHQLKSFASRNMMTFGLNNIARLKYTMQGMAAIKEGLFEGYYGKKNISYSDQPKQVRLMIKHNRNIGEGEARYRAIESLFVETAEGERFKLPFRNLMGGRIMARHVSEGGTPYDAFGQHITETISEIGTLSRFIRATRGKQFAGHTDELVEIALRHYSDLKDKAKRMISHRGYLEERDMFDPAEISESSATADAIRDLFIEQNVDQRIEEALPILAQLANKKENKMREADQFESWADGIMEGTWALPDTPEADTKLKELLSKPLIIGADATNATEQLYDLVGDDQLFDLLNDLADQDPNANAWDDPAVMSRLEELGVDTSAVASDDEENIDIDMNKHGIDPEGDYEQDDEVNENELNSMRRRAGIQQGVAEGGMEGQMHADADRMSRDQFCAKYGHENGTFWDSVHGDIDEAAGAVDFDKVLDAIAALYGDDIWENDAMQDLANDLEQAGPTDRELDFIIAKGRLPKRLAGTQFSAGDDVQFGEGILDTAKKVGSRVFDKLGGGSDEELLDKLRKDAGLPPRMATPNKKGVGEDLDTDGVMMTRPSNMSS